MENQKQNENTSKAPADIESSVLIAAKLDEIGQIAAELKGLGYEATFWETKVQGNSGLVLFLPDCKLTENGEVVEANNGTS